MREAFTKKVDDELRPEYDLTQLKGGVRGKYYKRAIAGTNLVLIEPDLAKVFPDADSVNRRDGPMKKRTKRLVDRDTMRPEYEEVRAVSRASRARAKSRP